ncbi:glycoside hydrolase family 10 protein [Laetiporus sulphureus 93-53]|uniref:endo-1,4-beta-xylanase n=1 Tax=Laetiporus sulphureus 93-53 TaxID=1314785 RepID=A0A165DDC3_9APHY|nr:glycoside hydrolase family 10 protein [Laetiporus sulphureus 93-53]KZT04623.1 glycoside hydrolase family 10 protein [Laetiporus sulphureus 93-53]
MWDLKHKRRLMLSYRDICKLMSDSVVKSHLGQCDGGILRSVGTCIGVSAGVGLLSLRFQVYGPQAIFWYSHMKFATRPNKEALIETNPLQICRLRSLEYRQSEPSPEGARLSARVVLYAMESSLLGDTANGKHLPLQWSCSPKDGAACFSYSGSTSASKILGGFTRLVQGLQKLSERVYVESDQRSRSERFWSLGSLALVYGTEIRIRMIQRCVDLRRRQKALYRHSPAIDQNKWDHIFGASSALPPGPPFMRDSLGYIELTVLKMILRLFVSNSLLTKGVLESWTEDCVDTMRAFEECQARSIRSDGHEILMSEISTVMVFWAASTRRQAATPSRIHGTRLSSKTRWKAVLGTATDNSELNDTAYDHILDSVLQFGALTADNSIKWEYSEPEPFVFNFTGGDQISELAHANGMLLRGDKYAWDVVNATFPLALRAVRAADPFAKLYINEYNTEYTGTMMSIHENLATVVSWTSHQGPKSTALLNLVKKLQADNVPIDAVCFQCHFTLGEICLGICMELPATAEMFEQQKTDYNTVVSACMSVPACVGVSVWDFTDKMRHLLITDEELF